MPNPNEPQHPLPADEAVKQVQKNIEAMAAADRANDERRIAAVKRQLAELRPGLRPFVPEWLAKAAVDLIKLAETLFEGERRGQARKAWVEDALRKLARSHDLAGVPEWIETPLEDLVIHLLVESLFQVIPRNITASLASARIR